MATLSELQAWRDRLRDARYSGVRAVQDSNGERIEYRSDLELSRAIAAVDAEIAGASAPRPAIIYPYANKGV